MPVFAVGIAPPAADEVPLTPIGAALEVSVVNLSVLKNDRARAIRCSTLAAICRALDCEIVDLLVRTD